MPNGSDERAHYERLKEICVIEGIALGFLVIGATIAYWIWPSGIADLPLAMITLGQLIRAAMACLMAIASAYAAFLIGYDP